MKMRISSFAQHLPAMAVVGASSDIYVATFPKGVPHVLSKFKDGSGYFGAVRNPDNGQFIAQARLNPLSDYAVVAGAFTVMSVVTSQYYLTEINNKLNTIRQGIDKILDFLYGDKRAELLSEVSFVKYAYENYASIMQHPEQRVATITSLQGAKKVAMKDLEFYLSDLDCLDSGKVEETASKALKLEDCLDLSAQLYVLSGIMESYYSQNFDEEYISRVEKEMSIYIDKTEKNILKGFSALDKAIDTENSRRDANVVSKMFGGGRVNEGYKQNVGKIVAQFSEGGESELTKTLHSAFHCLEQPVKVYIKSDGEAYMENTI